ncbi:MAG TPA: methyltransferase domain-containing protein [Terracidiphilus sp.]|jgi:SAM-dependent methyltransferase|nr:methyltransferase domain-containing protein [Terracidiphilus sp.]
MPTTLAAAHAPSMPGIDSFQRYYEEAGPDYAAWSPAFNMHFGFFRWGMNPFNREAMLEQMNVEILQRLHLEEAPSSHPRVLDMGCGLSATLRSIARRQPAAELHGITLVPWQLEQSRLLNQSSPQAAAITLGLDDYEHTAFASASFHAAYAIESSCYSNGTGKSRLIREARRLLRSGGRLVVADGFLGPGKLRGPQRILYRRLCDCWAIDTLGEIHSFAHELESAGFCDIVIEPMQARVTPSVLHVPWVTLNFLLSSVVLGTRKMTTARWNNVIAPLLLPFLGYPIGPLAYHLVSATAS